MGALLEEYWQIKSPSVIAAGTEQGIREMDESRSDNVGVTEMQRQSNG